MTLRVRCPSGDHTVELDDELAGARVRCPTCGRLFFAHGDALAAAIQPAIAEPANAPAAKDVDHLKDRIYDGLPPLSVMIALRRQNQDVDDHDAKLQMTPDDWRALDAYEHALIASYSLRTSVIVSGVAALSAVPLALLAMRRPDPNALDLSGRIAFAGLMLLGACCVVIYLGSKALRKVRVQGVLEFLFWALAIGMAVFASLAVFGVAQVTSMRYSGEDAFAAVLCIPFNGIALFDLARSSLRARAALKEIIAPEITNRLVEALKYVE
jgi:hypothetical protein